MTATESSQREPGLKQSALLTPGEINDRLEIPTERVSIAVKESEAQFMYDFLRKNKCDRTLEVGMGFGRSASHILAATKNNKHIAMDPFQSDYDQLGIKNIERLGFGDRLQFFPDFSHNVLPALHKEGRKFDFIFIDGDHKFDGVFVDFYYADLLLEEEGYILFHDTWMRSTTLVTEFVRTNRSDYEFIPTGLRNLNLIRKIGDDQRNGMYCREFYTPRKLVVHHAIMWMNEGKPNFLKRLALRAKELLK